MFSDEYSFHLTPTKNNNEIHQAAVIFRYAGTMSKTHRHTARQLRYARSLLSRGCRSCRQCSTNSIWSCELTFRSPRRQGRLPALEVLQKEASGGFTRQAKGALLKLITNTYISAAHFCILIVGYFEAWQHCGMNDCLCCDLMIAMCMNCLAASIWRILTYCMLCCTVIVLLRLYI